VSDVSRETFAVARRVFGDRFELAEQYAGLLASEGVERGLIGPRETPRLWDRHLLNCAVFVSAIPDGVTVADVGSGAGLPGLVVAIARPDLKVTLIEPLLRRTSFVEEVVSALGLSNVEVLRGRADEFHGKRTFDVVTSRAVAALDKLAAWSLPLVKPGGVVLAMKGSSAPDEVAAHSLVVHSLGGQSLTVEKYGQDLLEQPTTIVRITTS